MKLYLLSQNLNHDHDAYDQVVVAAESPDDAREIHPSVFVTHVSNNQWMGTYTKSGKEYSYGSTDWVKYSEIDQIDVEYLGETEKDRGVILSSFIN